MQQQTQHLHPLGKPTEAAIESQGQGWQTRSLTPSSVSQSDCILEPPPPPPHRELPVLSCYHSVWFGSLARNAHVWTQS